MSDGAGTREEAPGPTDNSDPLTLREFKRAIVWVAVVVAVLLLWFLSEPLLLIIGGIVVAQMLDGGVRLLGRILPVGRGIRLAIVATLVAAAMVAFLAFAGTQLTGQAQALQSVVTHQLQSWMDWAHERGFLPAGSGVSEIGQQLMGSFGKVTAALGTALGALSSMAMILVLGLFIAMEPRLYERGIAWMLPMANRESFYETTKEMGSTLRRLMAGRLLGMALEGVFVAIALEIVGVPMATLLGILTGLLAFLPNIGAIVSGVLIVLVGFSAGTDTGIWAIVVYVSVQTFDGYVVVPMVARRSVDLPPALVLGCQLLFGALFGILGLALADPMVAMVKVLLEKSSALKAEKAEAAAAEEAA
ncbi:AI-2E family transporter [Sphingomonas sp. AP4-R1]|uniref:AI-2E family transporter n=1 Tax=Sphingomonas sp. AP4-R1 TaxID=2735134 RepID=UPI001493BB00|nr:AI-2E family transporter [Sphingomonas sp. AP4-R1]QJU56661.1 AI-2E family transporter [Sphingomonas sp. AP4-R1]